LVGPSFVQAVTDSLVYTAVAVVFGIGVAATAIEKGCLIVHKALERYVSLGD
jgi:hypothetical protein